MSDTLETKAEVAAVSAWMEWVWAQNDQGIKQIPAECVRKMVRAVLAVVKEERERASTALAIDASKL